MAWSQSVVKTSYRHELYARRWWTKLVMFEMSVVFPVYQALVQMSVNVLNKCFHCVHPQKCFWKEYSQLRSFNRISKREVEVWPKGTGAHWVCQSIRTKLWDQVKRAYIFELFTSHLANCTLKYLCAFFCFTCPFFTAIWCYRVCALSQLYIKHVTKSSIKSHSI